MSVTKTHRTEAEHFVMRGLVQGRGVRPEIARMAVRHGIVGTVRNSLSGVEILAVGDRGSRRAFRQALSDTFDDASLVGVSVDNVVENRKDFRIVDSVAGSKLDTIVPLDLAVCPECLRDVRSSKNRRFGYPFTTCTRCGPRYSILHRMPFDRDSTSMAAFSMCRRCEAEYRDPRDRRFHAQTIACHDCGPTCWASDHTGNSLAGPSTAIQFVAERIANGNIAALKGIGGYQLVCDATNSQTVCRLRARKHRPGKPLPVMVGDLSVAEQYAECDHTERQALESPANPILLLRSIADKAISPAVSPRLNTIGLMLPTSPMHALLIDQLGKPLVVTSGNDHGAPLIHDPQDAVAQLSRIADVFLHHDREIVRSIDDSVVQCYRSQVTTIRAARGIAPWTVNSNGRHSSIATGGQQKVAPALGVDNYFVSAPHIGDMNTESCRIRLNDSVTQLQSLYRSEPSRIVCDRHPNYFTTDWSIRSEQSVVTVQHHHAHAAAAMLEHGLLDKTVLALTFDGTGYGDDKTIWGGEALIATTRDYKRVGHLRCFRLPGGENAIRRPSRIARSLLSQLDGSETADRLGQFAIKQGTITSSMGRLFDGVASMLLGIDRIDFEGEAAMRLEASVDPTESSSYRFDVCDSSPRQFDWRPVLSGIRDDMKRLSHERIAMKFHRAVANLVIEVASRYDGLPCLLTGGVFQNRLLLELVAQMADERSLDLRLPRKIPVNDGGLAIGQLVVASARDGGPMGGVSCV